MVTVVTQKGGTTGNNSCLVLNEYFASEVPPLFKLMRMNDQWNYYKQRFMKNKHAFFTGKLNIHTNRELRLFLAVPVLVFLFTFIIPWTRIFSTIINRYPSSVFVEIIITTIVLTFFVLGFTVSRLRKYKQTVGKQIIPEQHLNEQYTRLDEANKKILALEQLIEMQDHDAYIKSNNILNQRKELEQYLYITSHDLQEPLRTTLSLVTFLKEELDGKLNKDGILYMDGIVKMTGRMQTIIKDLLDYSRLGKDRVLKKVNCTDIMNDVIEDLQCAIQESDAEIHINNLPELMAYSTEIKLLFQNLIGNAIKYRKKELAPVIHVSAEREGSAWKFSLLDNGIGIEEKHINKIFMLFQRLHARDKFEGSGIGLAHCKKIVELHSGKIWVESSPDEGSIFYFTIPDKIYE